MSTGNTQVCLNVRMPPPSRPSDGAPTFDGERFRQLRQAAGVPLIDVVRVAGRVSYRHVQQFEHGPRHVSVELAHRLAIALTRLTGNPVTVDDFTVRPEEAA